MADQKIAASEEQLKYAGILDWGMKAGMVILFATFIVYLLGIMPVHVPVEKLPEYWQMPVKQYLKAADIHTGWWWLGQVGRADFMNFIGIAILSSVTVVCYLAIIPIYLKKEDRLYALLASIEVLVLLLAASGILGAGGH